MLEERWAHVTEKFQKKFKLAKQARENGKFIKHRNFISGKIQPHRRVFQAVNVR